MMDAMKELGIKLSTFDKALSILFYNVIICIAPGDLQKVLKEKTLLESPIFLVLMLNRVLELCHDFDTPVCFPIFQYHVGFAQHLATVISDSQQVLMGQLLLKGNMMLFAMYLGPPIQNVQCIYHVVTSKIFMDWSIYIIFLVQAKVFPANCMIVHGTDNILSFVTHENVPDHLYDLHSSLSAMSSDAKSTHRLLFLSVRNSSSLYNGTQFSTCLACAMILSFLHRVIQLQYAPFQSKDHQHHGLQSFLLTFECGSLTQAPAPASSQESFPLFESGCNNELFILFCFSPYWHRLGLQEFKGFYSVVLPFARDPAFDHRLFCNVCNLHGADGRIVVRNEECVENTKDRRRKLD